MAIERPSTGRGADQHAESPVRLDVPPLPRRSMIIRDLQEQVLSAGSGIKGECNGQTRKPASTFDSRKRLRTCRITFDALQYLALREARHQLCRNLLAGRNTLVSGEVLTEKPCCRESSRASLEIQGRECHQLQFGKNGRLQNRTWNLWLAQN